MKRLVELQAKALGGELVVLSFFFFGEDFHGAGWECGGLVKLYEGIELFYAIVIEEKVRSIGCSRTVGTRL